MVRGKNEYGLEELEQLRASSMSLPTLAGIKHKFTTREGWLGDADLAYLFIPNFNPWSKSEKAKKRRETPFYGLTDDLPIVVAVIAGFVHCLSAIAGIITPPTIFLNALGLGRTPFANYMVASSLIASGICSAVQMTRFKIPFTDRLFATPRYFGTGLITVTGTSFATLSTASAMFNSLYREGVCPSSLASDGVTVIRGACPEAYGYLLGTSALCSLTGMALSFMSPRAIRRILPPYVSGQVVLLIGASLIGESGFVGWGGGSACHATKVGFTALCPNIAAPKPLPWGSAQLLGLGFLSFVTIIIIELAGSPIMRNSAIVLALVVGMSVAGGVGYVDTSSIKSAPPITFLWVETFKLRIHAPSILPFMAVYVALASEALGDITASSEASKQPTTGLLYDSRVSAGILADGFNGMLSAFFTNAPVSIFAQNSGVIVLTRCANRSAGYICAAFLVLFGVLAKLSGVILAIPPSVLGGVTVFLFATVMVSGLKIISESVFSRRNRIVMAAGLSVGIGNIIISDFPDYLFTYSGSNTALRGFMNAIQIILGTPFLIAALVSIVVNLILPLDDEDVESPKAILDNGDADEEGAIQVMPAVSGDYGEDDTKKEM